MFVFSLFESSSPEISLAGKNPEERNVLDELLGEHPNDDDDLTDELHLSASGKHHKGLGIMISA